MTSFITALDSVIARFKADKANAVLAKFSSLAHDSLEAFQKIEYYHQRLPLLFLDTSGKSSDGHHNDLKQALLKPNATLFHEHKVTFEQDQHKIKRQNWYAQQQALLQKEAIWQQFLTACRNDVVHTQVLELKKDWMRHAHYAHYTSDALVAMASQVLCAYEEYCHLLQREYQQYKKSLSPRLQQHFQQLIQRLFDWLKAEQQQVIQAMLARLHMASEAKDPTFADVTMHLVGQLNTLGVLKNVSHFVQQSRRDLTPTALSYFHQYIAQRGNREQVKLLQTLAWHRSDTQHSVLQHKKQLLVVPKTLLPWVEHKPLAHRLFGWKHAEYHYLQARNALLIQLRFLPCPAKSLDKVTQFLDNPAWQQLCQLTRLLQQELVSAENQLPQNFLSRLLQPRKSAFLTHWQQYMVQQQRQVLEHKLEYARYLAQQLHTRLDFNLDHPELRARYFQACLEHFKADLQEHMASLHITLADLPDDQLTFMTLDKVLALPRKPYVVKDKKNQEGLDVAVQTRMQNQNQLSIQSNEALSDESDFVVIDGKEASAFSALPVSSSANVPEQAISTTTALRPDKDFVFGDDETPAFPLFAPVVEAAATALAWEPHAAQASLSDPLGILPVEPEIPEPDLGPSVLSLQAQLTALMVAGKFDLARTDFLEEASQLNGEITAIAQADPRVLNNPTFASLFQELFLAYLRTWIDAVEANKAKILQQLEPIESLLQQCASAEIKACLGDVILLRNRSHFLYQAKCRAVLVSLDAKELSESHLEQLANRLPAIVPAVHQPIHKGHVGPAAHALPFFQPKYVYPGACVSLQVKPGFGG